MEHFWTHVCISLLLLISSRVKVGGAREKKPGKYDFVRVQVPTYAREGETVFLKCLYDVDIDRLYSMKWYKGSQEFFRFTPKESPSIKTFLAFGENVDRGLSNYSQVALRAVSLNMTDKYTCEVTKDFPDYTTSMKTAKMTVVSPPERQPLISSDTKSASVGDTLTVNCTSFRSNPAVNITFLLNTFPVGPHYLTPPVTIRDIDNKDTITIGLNFTLRHHHFIRSRMTVTCQAKIEPDVYNSSVNLVIMEHDRLNLHYISNNYTSLLSAMGGKSPDSNHITSSGSLSTHFATTADTLAQLVLVFLFRSSSSST